MIQSIPRETIVETLLNSLEAERYVRGALLATVADELSGAPGLRTAEEAARAILAGLQAGQLVESEFVARIRALRDLVQALAEPPESGEILVRDALGRAVPRNAVVATATTTASAA